MSRSQPTVFVFWSDAFEEAAAVLFVSELRRLGLRVKVVGLRGPQAAGIHGLALLPDLTLGQALPAASQSCCVVLPCPVKRLQMVKNELRLHTFFQQAAANGALFVIGQAEGEGSVGHQNGFVQLAQALNYPPLETLLAFITALADQLQQCQSAQK